MSLDSTTRMGMSHRPGSRAKQLTNLHAEIYPRLVTLLARKGTPRCVAEDAVSEAFARAVLKLPDPISDDSAAAWLYRVSRNLVVSEYRRQSRLQRAIEEGRLPDTRCEARIGPEETWLLYELQQDLDTTLASASVKDARLLRSRYLEGQSIAEIACARGWAIGSTRVAISLALRRAMSSAPGLAEHLT